MGSDEFIDAFGVIRQAELFEQGGRLWVGDSMFGSFLMAKLG